MEREEMLTRLGIGEDPLDLTIEKWERIAAGTGKNREYSNCALCEVYSKRGTTPQGYRACKGCPVSKKTGMGNCLNTPYCLYIRAEGNRAPKERLAEIARIIVRFLKDLKRDWDMYDQEVRDGVEYDPWNLLGLLRPSEHCPGKLERIIEYVHTGEVNWRCDCGHETGWV